MILGLFLAQYVCLNDLLANKKTLTEVKERSYLAIAVTLGQNLVGNRKRVSNEFQRSNHSFK